jgi:Na+-translocating ferredoxin:NAD+ oxidoreductase RnfE subunit
VLLILGLIAGPIIESAATEQQLATNVFLSAIPFILIFAAIILAFITLIVLVSNLLSNRIPERIYRPIERIIIAGIVLGIIAMFQPWSFVLYRIGFFMVLISTLCFIVWSHIKPWSGDSEQEEPVAAASEA